MKPYLILSALIVILFAACKKSNNAVAALNTTAKDSSSAVTHTATQVAATVMYPYTDTFVGSLTTSFTDVYGVDNYSYNPYVFYVIHPDAASLILVGTSSIQVEHDGGALNFYNRMPVDSSGTYACKGAVTFNATDHSSQVGANLQVIGNSLFLSWDGEAWLIGACDYGELQGQFTGVRKGK